MTRLALLLSLAVAGCGTRNALLELSIDVPTEAPAVEVLLVSDPPASPSWDEAAAEPLPERGDVARVDVLAEAPAIEAPLAVGLRRCDGAPCAGPPEVWWRLERAFYLGRVTRFSMAFPDAPPGGPIEVGRCAVPGCLDGDEVTDFCRLDGTHYCEE